MSAVDEAALMILRAKHKEAKGKANQSEVYAVYVNGTKQEGLDPVPMILEQTLSTLAMHEAKYERERADYFAQAVDAAEKEMGQQ